MKNDIKTPDEERNEYLNLKSLTTPNRRRLKGKIAKVIGTAYTLLLKGSSEFTASEVAKALGEKTSSNTSKYLKEAARHGVLTTQEVRGVTHYRFKCVVELKGNRHACTREDRPFRRYRRDSDTAHALTPAYIYAYLRLALERTWAGHPLLKLQQRTIITLATDAIRPRLRAAGCTSALHLIEVGIKRVVSTFIKDCVRDKKCKFIVSLGGTTKQRAVNVHGEVHEHWQEAYKVACLHSELRTLSQSGGDRVSGREYDQLVDIQFEYSALLVQSPETDRKRLYDEAVSKMREILK